jgi:hypothetical protein
MCRQRREPGGGCGPHRTANTLQRPRRNTHREGTRRHRETTDDGAHDHGRFHAADRSRERIEAGQWRENDVAWHDAPKFGAPGLPNTTVIRFISKVTIHIIGYRSQNQQEIGKLTCFLDSIHLLKYTSKSWEI